MSPKPILWGKKIEEVEIPSPGNANGTTQGKVYWPPADSPLAYRKERVRAMVGANDGGEGKFWSGVGFAIIGIAAVFVVGYLASYFLASIMVEQLGSDPGKFSIFYGSFILISAIILAVAASFGLHKRASAATTELFFRRVLILLVGFGMVLILLGILFMMGLFSSLDASMLR